MNGTIFSRMSMESHTRRLICFWRTLRMSKKALDEMEKFLLRDAGILPECPVCGKLECECDD